MKRKDCESSTHAGALGRYRLGISRPVMIACLIAASASEVRAGSVRLWPSAAVVDEAVRLTDLCELTGFDVTTEQALSDCIVTDSPPPGGTRLIHLEMIRSALAAAGANMAETTLRGAISCEVSRPSHPASQSPSPPPPQHSRGSAASSVSAAASPIAGQPTRPDSVATTGLAVSTGNTLRQAVQDYFDAELKRYGGKAEVTFDRASEQILDLSGPAYEFEVRRRRGDPVGLTSVEVRVLANGRIVQTVPLVVQVAMRLHVAVARRPINQGAAIRPSDLQLVPMSVTRILNAGIGDLALAIGQRAKRFIPVGTTIEPGMLEEVPLVQRGELVTLASVVGGIRVVTTAKAAESGLLGDVITVRAVDNKRVEFEAVVVGPGAVEVTPGVSLRREVQLAMREVS